MTEPLQGTPGNIHPPGLANDDPAEWELTLGTRWFGFIGIAVLLIGLAMALNYAMPYLTTPVKVLGAWLLTAGMFWGGTRLYASIPRLGRILQGGALALGYLVLFGMFFIPAIQLFNSTQAGLMLLGAYVAGMIALSQTLKSQTIAVIALGFGYYTGTYSGSAPVAMGAGLLLSAAAVVIQSRFRDWFALIPTALAAAYITGSGQSYQNLGGTYLLGTFAVFHTANLILRNREDVAVTAVNGFLFYACLRLTNPGFLPGWELPALLTAVYAGTLAVLGRLPEKSSGFRDLLLVLTAESLGIATIQAFPGQDFQGNALSGCANLAMLALEAVVFGVIARRAEQPLLPRIFAYIFYGLAGCLLFYHQAILPENTLQTGWLLTTLGIGAAGFILESLIREDPSGVSSISLLLTIALLMFVGYLQCLPGHWITLAYATTGFGLILTGLAANWKRYRVSGLCWLGMATLHLLVSDLPTLSTPYRIILFIGLGLGLLGASYAYSRVARRTGQAPE